MFILLHNWLVGQGLNPELAAYLTRGLAAAAALLLAVIANYVARRYIVAALNYLISRSKWRWDDALLRQRALNRLAHLAPAVVLYALAPLVLEGMDTLLAIVRGALQIYMILIVVLVLDSLLNVVEEVYRNNRAAKQIPLKGFIQTTKLVLYFIAAIWVIAILLGKTPIYLLSGLTAMTAVTMLVFRDAILGFVAGIQLAANKMVSVGDWIEMPKYGADGDVLEVTLTTVKIQNWDKTITTVPTYALISESFKNWRGMAESGGRRIKRAVDIDISTIRFCNEEMLERFAKIRYIADYIEAKRHEIEAHNRELEVDNSILANGRHLTNIGTFRAYVSAYLRNHPQINLDMTFLVRQLPPGPTGLPLEIYVFCKDKVWAHYEAIQADIFDHVLAVAPEFDLRVFQYPSGADLRSLASLRLPAE